MNAINYLPGLYVTIALSHFLLQIWLAYWYQETYKASRIPPSAKILVLIPGYREDLSEIRATIESCIAACNKLPNGYRARIVYVEDDAYSDRLLPLHYEYLGNPIVDIVACGRNLGKRHAQYVGYSWIVSESQFYPDYVITVDSDTRIEPHSILSLLHQFDAGTGAVTGNIAIYGADTLLQKLIAMRYWLAFSCERASQSVFGEVLCCSGPLTAYRGAIWRDVMPKYLNQYFCGKACTYGDDRRMTSLVLQKGFKTRFDYRATCRTAAPKEMAKYIKQQTRWAKSFFRESLLMFSERTIFNRHRTLWYGLWETFVALSLPILLSINLVYLLCRSHENWLMLASYLATIVIVAWVRAGFGIWKDTLNPKLWYAVFPLFALMNLIILFPIRVWAILTINDGKWGTR